MPSPIQEFESEVIVGLFLFAIGMAVYLIGGLMLVVKAFRVSVNWGLATLFIPFAALVFVIKHWEESKGTFFTIVTGMALLVLGGMAIPRPTPDGTRASAFDTATATETSRTEAERSYASAAAPPAYTPPLNMAPIDPAPRPVRRDAETTTVVEEPKQTRFEQVYVDRDARLYYAENCKKRPAEAYRVAKSVAVMQGMAAAKCP